jgi:hypothetical protein
VMVLLTAAITVMKIRYSRPGKTTQ